MERNLYVRGMLMHKILHFSEVNYEDDSTHTMYQNTVHVAAMFWLLDAMETQAMPMRGQLSVCNLFEKLQHGDHITHAC